MCAGGGFRLTKFVSNTKYVFVSVPEDECKRDVADQDMKFTMLSTEKELEICAIVVKIVLVLMLASKKNHIQRGVN